MIYHEESVSQEMIMIVGKDGGSIEERVIEYQHRGCDDKYNL